MTNAPPFRQKAPTPRTLTSERIAQDLGAFQSSGGRIEVLGNTRALKKIGNTADTPAESSPSVDATVRRR